MRSQIEKASRGSNIYAGCLYTIVIIYTAVFLFGRSFLPPQEKWCPYSTNTSQSIKYSNPDYNYHPCYKYRTPYLFYLHLQEVEFAQRMLFSLLLGGIIGFERRASERPAGIRTMSMVSLGSCFFSMTSQLAFKSSTMGWDAARVAAAVPSGVGFLGAGLIWKGSSTSTREVDGKIVTSSSQEVHGLTTAASVWLSAAVGVAVGGGRRLYIVSVYGVALVILVLRFGPRIYFSKDSESEEDWEDDSITEDWEDFTDDSSGAFSAYEDQKEEGKLETITPRFETGNGLIQNQETEHLLNRPINSLSRPLIRHVSAPNIFTLTYETPIIDHSNYSKDNRRINNRKKNTNNMLKLKFHG